MSVSRLQVLPKFLQDIHARYRPSDDTWIDRVLITFPLSSPGCLQAVNTQGAEAAQEASTFEL